MRNNYWCAIVISGAAAKPLPKRKGKRGVVKQLRLSKPGLD